MLTFTHQFGPGAYFALRFSAKPDERIRAILKGAGFRWSPSSATWWRSRVTGGADFLAALSRAIDDAHGIRRPVGPCWACQSPDGFFRNRGAASPVWCDACVARFDAEEKSTAGDSFDLRVEDAMREACGL
jgi:hypothetical protein